MTVAPPIAAPAAAGGKDLKLVYADEMECMEEKRAKLDRYRYDEAAIYASATAATSEATAATA